MDPLASFMFRVRIGTQEFGFSKISGLQREAEPVTYQEGGLNDRIHVLPGTVKSCGMVHFERGVYAGEYFPFYLAGEQLAKPLRIEVKNPNDRSVTAKIYTLTGIVVKKWEAGELDAQQGVVFIDRFDLNYEYLSITLS